MRDQILNKITKLKEWWLSMRGEAEDLEQIDNWMDEAKRLILIENLSQHDGMKYVRAIFENEVSSIDSLLLESYSKTLPDGERDRLLDRKDLAQKYLNLFSGVEKNLEDIEESVDNELNRT